MRAPTIHDILARIDIPVTPDDSQQIRIHVEYSYRPGWDGDFTDPGYDAELDLRDAILVETEGPEPDRRQLWELADKWLHGEGYLAACERAQERGGFDAQA